MTKTHANDFEINLKFAKFIYEILIEKLNVIDIEESRPKVMNRFSDLAVSVDQLKKKFFDIIVTVI